MLAVADVVEAMSSHRPYRVRLGLDAALEEINRGKGAFYDPEVVEVCIRLFRQTYSNSLRVVETWTVELNPPCR